ncbi:MAG TPA: hypothetical protein VHP38_14130 [Ruminiclostridium sp.]|nr:hypothetical protein [Ruminiclostridium sp.]
MKFKASNGAKGNLSKLFLCTLLPLAVIALKLSLIMPYVLSVGFVVTLPFGNNFVLQKIQIGSFFGTGGRSREFARLIPYITQEHKKRGCFLKQPL